MRRYVLYALVFALSLILLLTWFNSAFAQEVATTSGGGHVGIGTLPTDLTILHGNSVTVPVWMDNLSNIVGVQGTIKTNASIVESNLSVKRLFNASECSINNQPGEITFACMRGTPFTADEFGGVFNLSIKAHGGVGRTSPIEFTYLKALTSDMEERQVTPINGSVTILGSISGRVLDAYGEPLMAEVTLYDLNGDVHPLVVQANGTFAKTDILQPGGYFVTFAKAYNPAEPSHHNVNDLIAVLDHISGKATHELTYLNIYQDGVVDLKDAYCQAYFLLKKVNYGNCQVGTWEMNPWNYNLEVSGGNIVNADSKGRQIGDIILDNPEDMVAAATPSIQFLETSFVPGQESVIPVKVKSNVRGIGLSFSLENIQLVTISSPQQFFQVDSSAIVVSDSGEFIFNLHVVGTDQAARIGIGEMLLPTSTWGMNQKVELTPVEEMPQPELEFSVFLPELSR